MRSLNELDGVRVVRLIDPARAYQGTEGVAHRPHVGDVGTIVHVAYAEGVSPCYIVECVDAEGYTAWLADFTAEELARDR